MILEYRIQVNCTLSLKNIHQSLSKNFYFRNTFWFIIMKCRFIVLIVRSWKLAKKYTPQTSRQSYNNLSDSSRKPGNVLVLQVRSLPVAQLSNFLRYLLVKKKKLNRYFSSFEFFWTTDKWWGFAWCGKSESIECISDPWLHYAANAICSTY